MADQTDASGLVCFVFYAGSVILFCESGNEMGEIRPERKMGGKTVEKQLRIKFSAYMSNVVDGVSKQGKL